MKKQKYKSVVYATFFSWVLSFYDFRCPAEFFKLKFSFDQVCIKLVYVISCIFVITGVIFFVSVL